MLAAGWHRRRRRHLRHGRRRMLGSYRSRLARPASACSARCSEVWLPRCSPAPLDLFSHVKLQRQKSFAAAPAAPTRGGAPGWRAGGHPLSAASLWRSGRIIASWKSHCAYRSTLWPPALVWWTAAEALSAMSAQIAPFTAARPGIAPRQSQRSSSRGTGWRGRPRPARVAPRAAAGFGWDDDCLVASATSHTVEAASSQWATQPIAELAAAAAAPQPQADAATAAGPLGISPVGALLVGGAVLGAYGIKKVFDTPSRTYDQNVGQEYDAWTEEGVLEYYWGEHIHLGYYNDEVGAGWAVADAGWQAGKAGEVLLGRGRQWVVWRGHAVRLAGMSGWPPSHLPWPVCNTYTYRRSGNVATRRRTSSRPSTTLWRRCCRWAPWLLSACWEAAGCVTECCRDILPEAAHQSTRYVGSTLAGGRQPEHV